MRRGTYALCVLAICGCAVAGQPLGNREDASHFIFVVHDNWHSAIVSPAAYLSPATLPETRDFTGADYLEFSWGDREYFPHPDPGPGLALKAAFRSSGSILHVVGMRGSVEASYPQADIITIALTPEELERIIEFISRTFARPHPDTPGEPQPGLSEDGRFYSANGRFSLLRTCNTWVAEALHAAGLPIDPGWVITAGSLGRKVRPLGVTVRERRAPSA
jgi:uncharacterized protein (TIGR02117 family)